MGAGTTVRGIFTARRRRTFAGTSSSVTNARKRTGALEDAAGHAAGLPASA